MPALSAYTNRQEPTFEERFGELLRTERGMTRAQLVQTAAQIEQRQALAHQPLSSDCIAIFEGDSLRIRPLQQHLNEGGLGRRLLKKLRFYSGYEQAVTTERFARIASERIAQFKEMQNSQLPELNGIGVRNRVIRGVTIAKELKGLLWELPCTEMALESQQQQLNWLARKIYELIQRAVFFFMKSEVHRKQFVQLATSMGWGEFDGLDHHRGSGLLFDLIKGKTDRTVRNHCVGFKVNRLSLNVNGIDQQFGVYLRPLDVWGNLSIILSRHDDWVDASIDQLHFRWYQPTGRPFVTEAEIYRHELSRRMLHSTAVTDLIGRNAETGDRPMMRALAQIFVELLARQNERILQHSHNHSDSHVFVPAGFESDRGTAEPLAQVRQARQNGKKFPELTDEGSFQMQLRNDRRSILDAPVDLVDHQQGRSPKTWSQLIAERPILPGHGKFLPEFWRVDPRRLEVGEAVRSRLN